MLRLITASFSDAFAEAEFYVIVNSPVIGLLGRPRGSSLTAASGPSGLSTKGVYRLCQSDAISAWVASSDRNTDDFPRVEFLAAASHISRPSQQPTGVMPFVSKHCVGGSEFSSSSP